MNHQSWARFFCRVLLGLLFLMAGWFKCFELTPMVHAQNFFTSPYADTWIPYPLLLITGLAIPMLELITGLQLIVGWRTREALLVIGGILLLVTYGHLLKEPLFSIKDHIFPRAALLVAVLLLPAESDRLSVDGWREGKAEGRKRKAEG